MGNSWTKVKKHDGDRAQGSIRKQEASSYPLIDFYKVTTEEDLESLNIPSTPCPEDDSSCLEDSASCMDDTESLLRQNCSNYVRTGTNNGTMFIGNTGLNVWLGRLFPNSHESGSGENHPALKDLQNSLQLLYTGEESWIVPFPWIEENIYDLEEYFIRMDMEELDRRGTKIGCQNIQINSIFESLDKKMNHEPRRILLQAEAGFGKSTTSMRIAFDWAAKEESNFRKFALVILVRLRTLVGSLEDFVTQFAVRACKQRIKEKEMQKLLASLEGKLLLILDGLDECPKNELKFVERVIKLDKYGVRQSYLRGATILMTTRPSLKTKIYLCIERHIRIRRMSVVERELFVRKYFENHELADSVMRLFKRKIFQWDMSPLVMFLICNLVKEGEISNLQEESKVFYSIFQFLGKRYASKECLDWTEQEITEKLVGVGKLSFNLLKYNLLIFKKSELSKWCSASEEFVVGCGIFRKQLTCSLFQREECYEPVHKTFIEQLAALYLQWQCDQAKTKHDKIAFLKSVISRFQQQVSTVSLYDFEDTNEIRFKSNILPGSIDVLITKCKGKSGEDLKFEILPHTEMVLKIQPSDDSPCSVSLKITTYLSINPTFNSFEPEWIPMEYRDVICNFIDEYGRVMCKFMIRKSCICTMNMILIHKSKDNHIKQFVSFDYSEDNNTCSNCSLSKIQWVSKMFLKAEKHAKQFSIRRSPSQIIDTAHLLSKMGKSKNLRRPHFTTNLTYLGDIKGAAEVLSYAVSISGLPKRCYESIATESIGSFLLWVLKVFGYFGRVTSIFYSDIERCQCLRIQYDGIVYSFGRSNTGSTSYLVLCGQNVESLSSSAMKKLVRTWENCNVAPETMYFDVNFSCSVKLLTCEIIVTLNTCQDGEPCFDRFTMDKFQI